MGDKENIETLVYDNIKYIHNLDNEHVKSIDTGELFGKFDGKKIIWEKSGIVSKLYSGKWYRETGSGMGTTINVAIGMGGYTLTDRATWISFTNKRNLKIICQNKPPLLNQYGIIAVNPKINKRINYQSSLKYIN